MVLVRVAPIVDGSIRSGGSSLYPKALTNPSNARNMGDRPAAP
jgi:hypothetical protein